MKRHRYGLSGPFHCQIRECSESPHTDQTEACLMIKETEEREEEKDQKVKYTCMPFTLMQGKPFIVTGCNASYATDD